MRKDYKIINRYDDNLSDELSIVKDEWENIWKDVDIKYIFVDDFKGREEYKAMLPYLFNGAKILDMGSGLGEWVKFFNKSGYDAFGVDIYGDVVARLSSDKFICADMRDTPFDDESFDIVCSWGAFEHFEGGIKDSLFEAKRVLKKDGILCITVPYYNIRHIINDLKKFRIKKLDKNTKLRFYQWRFTKRDIFYELASSGFEILEIVPIHKNHGLWRMIRGDLGIKSGTKMMSYAHRILKRILPAVYVAHMLFVVAKKENKRE